MKNLTLIIAVCFSVSVNAQVNCDELFFSEYIEGYSQNKALEIYNPTNNQIDNSNKLTKHIIHLEMHSPTNRSW